MRAHAKLQSATTLVVARTVGLPITIPTGIRNGCHDLSLISKKAALNSGLFYEPAKVPPSCNKHGSGAFASSAAGACCIASEFQGKKVPEGGQK
jgi:hypothetical protein